MSIVYPLSPANILCHEMSKEKFSWVMSYFNTHTEAWRGTPLRPPEDEIINWTGKGGKILDKLHGKLQGTIWNSNPTLFLVPVSALSQLNTERSVMIGLLIPAYTVMVLSY
jgi:hypothetical protein